jgi:hypothetical protein
LRVEAQRPRLKGEWEWERGWVIQMTSREGGGKRNRTW